MAKKLPYDERLENLSRMAAMMFVTARAFSLWNKKLETEAYKLRQCHTEDSKYALKMIEDGCKKVRFGLDHFEDWGINSGVTDSGHCGDDVCFKAFIEDGAWVAALTALTANATHENENTRVFIESWCKSQVKGEPLISYDVINSLKPN